MPTGRLLFVVVTVAVAAMAPAEPAYGGWRPPVGGGVVRPFDLGPDPFEAGRHRGVDLAAPPAATVRAPCPGRVAFAGAVGAGGRVVTILCGHWRVTHMPLATLAVRPGEHVDPGARLGTVAAPHASTESAAHAGLHLGVRRDGTRFGYVDPLRFLVGAHAPRPLLPRPRTSLRRWRPPRLGPAPRLARPPLPAAARGHEPVAPRPVPSLPATLRHGSVAPRRGAAGAAGAGSPAAAGSSPAGNREPAPWPAWAGLALVVAGLGLRWSGRDRRHRARVPGRLAGAGRLSR